MMYVCFVTKDSEDQFNFEVVHISDYALKRDEEGLSIKNMHLKNLIGTEVVSTLITNDKVTYLKYRLEWKIKEAKAYSLHMQAYSQMLEDRGIDEKVVDETRKLGYDYTEILLREVGRTYSRLLSKGVSIEDEFAITCYNFYTAYSMYNNRMVDCINEM